MNADIDQLATLVAAQLTAAAGAGSFSQNFTCEYNDTPIFEASDLVDLKVTMMPGTILIAPTRVRPGQQRAHRFRGINEYQYVLSLQFAKAGPQKPATPPDPITSFSAGLRLLVQEVIHWFNKDDNRRPQLDPAGTSLWLKTIEVLDLYNMNRLKHERVFQSTHILTYEEFVRE